MKELTVALLMWIGSHTPLAYDGSHAPGVVRVHHDELVQILYQDDRPRDIDVDNVSVAGLYNFKDGNIYLLDSVDVSTVEGRAVLVHELVHYLQYHHGQDKSIQCMRMLEPQAYRTQADYLDQHGKTSPFNELHILLASQCSPMYM